MKLSSLPLKMSVSYRNRTYNRVLGGPRYIHLTKETNAVFSGFSALLAPASISMNSTTLVMNFHLSYFDSGDGCLSPILHEKSGNETFFITAKNERLL